MYVGKWLFRQQYIPKIPGDNIQTFKVIKHFKRDYIDIEEQTDELNSYLAVSQIYCWVIHGPSFLEHTPWQLDTAKLELLSYSFYLLFRIIHLFSTFYFTVSEYHSGFMCLK